MSSGILPTSAVVMSADEDEEADDDDGEWDGPTDNDESDE